MTVGLPDLPAPLRLRRHGRRASRQLAGSAAWSLSFADMSLLLLCLFIMLFSYARSDASRFKALADGVRQAFGLQSGTAVTPADPAVQAAAQAVQQLHQAFASELSLGVIDIRQRDRQVEIRMGDAGAFASGDAQLTPLSQALIAQVVAVAGVRDAQITIGGHTDNIPIRGGRYRDNWELSAARAIAVVRELVDHHGIDPAHVHAQGFADTQPIASNDLPLGRASNRRIEILVSW